VRDLEGEELEAGGRQRIDEGDSLASERLAGVTGGEHAGGAEGSFDLDEDQALRVHGRAHPGHRALHCDLRRVPAELGPAPVAEDEAERDLRARGQGEAVGGQAGSALEPGEVQVHIVEICRNGPLKTKVKAILGLAREADDAGAAEAAGGDEQGARRRLRARRERQEPQSPLHRARQRERPLRLTLRRLPLWAVKALGWLHPEGAAMGHRELRRPGGLTAHLHGGAEANSAGLTHKVIAAEHREAEERNKAEGSTTRSGHGHLWTGSLSVALHLRLEVNAT
jgi:hypothetical protein